MSCARALTLTGPALHGCWGRRGMEGGHLLLPEWRKVLLAADLFNIQHDPRLHGDEIPVTQETDALWSL